MWNSFVLAEIKKYLEYIVRISFLALQVQILTNYDNHENVQYIL